MGVNERTSRSRVWVAAVALAALFGCGGSETPLQPPPAFECFRVADPYARSGTWYRGNFHTHSGHSDGAMLTDKLVDTYQRHGYSVLCVSDHNCFGDQDGGIVPHLQTDSIVHDWNGDGIVHPELHFGSGVEANVVDFSRPQATWKRDLWYRGDITRVPPVLVSGAELSDGAWHIVVVGLPPGAVSASPPYRTEIQRGHDAGGFVFLAHPGEWNNDPGRLTELFDFHAYDGLEVMNGLRLSKSKPVTSDAVRSPVDCAAGNPPADATPLWDGLLGRGYRLWGLANDDAHTWDGAPEAYPATAFDMLLTDDTTQDGFLGALHAGAFYGSTGLYFRELGMQDDSLVAWAPEAESVRFIGWAGRELLVTSAPRATYYVTGNEGYVRVEATAAPGHDPWPRQAWSQPFFIENAPCGPGTRPKQGAQP